MADVDDQHMQLPVVDVVDHTVVADSDPPALRSHKPRSTLWSRVFGKRIDRRGDPSSDGTIQSVE